MNQLDYKTKTTYITRKESYLNTILAFMLWFSLGGIMVIIQML